LRERVREQPFRPLATSLDLPSGWCVEITRPEMLHNVLETVYPGVAADWSAHQRSAFTVESLAETIARQTGMYRALEALNQEQRAETVVRVCGNCVRHPTWFDGAASPVPCGEACNLWLTAALESTE
jgi:hypothetical protein